MVKTSLNGHVLIIGGTSGTGKAFAEAAGSRHKVSVVGRREIKSQGIASYKYDLRDASGLGTLINEIAKVNGRFSSLVFFQRNREGNLWQDEITVSLSSTHEIIERALPHFEESGGAIVAVSSMAATFVASEQPIAYHVAKAGLLQLVKYYAYTLGERGIRVNAVTPGTIIKEENKEFFIDNPELHDFYKSIIPLRRMGTSQDIIAAVQFLCGPESPFVTGQNLVVDGGLSLALQDSLARDISPFKHPQSKVSEKNRGRK